MTFRQMELFIAVCEHKNISKASQMHFVTQQGISKTIRELETELGCTLLHRTKTGVLPTECGAYFLSECRLLIEKKDYICSHISQLKEIPHEVIHLGMAYGIISALPHTVIPDFEASHEHVTIDYSDHTDIYLETLLKRGDLDFCVTSGVFDSDSFASEKLFDEKIYLCVPKEHELYGKPNITMQDIHNQKFAMFSTQFHIRHNFMHSCKKADIEPIIEISSSDFNSLKEIALHNNLLSVVPAHTITGNITSSKYIEFPDSDYVWSVYFTKRKNKILTPNSEAFLSYIKQQIMR